MSKVTQNNFNQSRNDYQQYDLVSIFKAAEIRTMRHICVASMAWVSELDVDNPDYYLVTPFPVREGEASADIKAYNINGCEYEKGEAVLVLFTDRDFRSNINNTKQEVAQTNDNDLHSQLYGVIIAPYKEK